MTTRIISSRPVAAILALAAFALTELTPLRAADEKAPSPVGSWTWTVPGRNGGPDRKNTLKIKVEGEKITGQVVSPGRDGQSVETPIQEVKLSGSDLSFKVTREFNGNKFVANYTGKVGTESIKGKMESERNGEKMSRDWEAKRETEKSEKK